MDAVPRLSSSTLSRLAEELSTCAEQSKEDGGVERSLVDADGFSENHMASCRNSVKINENHGWPKQPWSMMVSCHGQLMVNLQLFFFLMVK